MPRITKCLVFQMPNSTLVVSKISIFCIWPSHPLKHLHVYYSATNQLSMTFAVIEVKTRCHTKNIGKPGQQCWSRRRMVVMMLKKLLSNNDPGLTYSESWFRARREHAQCGILRNFPATQILRAINFGKFCVVRTATSIRHTWFHVNLSSKYFFHFSQCVVKMTSRILQGPINHHKFHFWNATCTSVRFCEKKISIRYVLQLPIFDANFRENLNWYTLYLTYPSHWRNQLSLNVNEVHFS